jgi:hypothetical protein
MLPSLRKVRAALLEWTGRSRFALQTAVLLAALEYHIENVKAFS